MPTLMIILIAVVAFLLISGLVAMLCITYPISKKVYTDHLVRGEQNSWRRECSAPDNEEQVQMWNEGIRWAEEHKGCMTEVSIVNDGLTLYGEYYDFGSDRCVIVSPGRCECLMYSYYFAKPYQEAGLNVLVIDVRSHGRSDGTYSSIGLYESQDLRAWMTFMQKEKGIKGFWMHGICIGSSAALLAAKDCADGIDGIVLEGCFTSFRESFKQHIKANKKPVHPVLDMVMFHIWRYAKANVYTIRPIKTVKYIHCPVLFLFGKMDVFSLPSESRKLFDACASKDKKLVWFDVGAHSHLRINNTEKYDNAIKEFVDDYEKSHQ